MWKEPVECRGKKTQKLSESEGRCGGHFVARRLVHGAWWECDDESVKRYNEHFVWERRAREPGQRCRSGGGGRDGDGPSGHSGGQRFGKVLGPIPRPLNSEPEDIPASAS